MAKKVNYGKILAVLFLTVLIWVWADLAKTAQFTIADATVNITTPSNPRLWVSFPRGSTASIQEILVKGATSRIDRLQRSIRAGERMALGLDVTEEKMIKEGDHTLLLQPFLNKRIQEKYGLKVEACIPEKIVVHVRSLVQKSLEVNCIDENGNIVKAVIDPARVDMFVPANGGPAAEVILTTAEIEQARTTPISKRPFYEFAPGQRTAADTAVKITTPTRGLTPETIDKPRLGYVLSGNLVGKYKPLIEGDNLVNVYSPIRIKATTEAKLAYESQIFQLILEIKDGDEKSTEVLRRSLIYNFPDEYLRTKQIELNQQPVEAHFKLIRLPAPSAASAAGS